MPLTSFHFLFILAGRSFQSPDSTVCSKGDSVYITSLIRTGMRGAIAPCGCLQRFAEFGAVQMTQRALSGRCKPSLKDRKDRSCAPADCDLDGWHDSPLVHALNAPFKRSRRASGYLGVSECTAERRVLDWEVACSHRFPKIPALGTQHQHSAGPRLRSVYAIHRHQPIQPASVVGASEHSLD